MTAMSKPVEPESLDSTIKTIQQTLRDKKRVNIAVPSGGRLYIDRQLPFLCVYRSAGKVEDVFDSQLITTQAAFFITPKLEDGKEDPARAVCQSIIEVLTPVFGRFLLLEVWLRYADSGSDDSEEPDAGITVNVHPGHAEENAQGYERRHARVGNPAGPAGGRLESAHSRFPISVEQVSPRTTQRSRYRSAVHAYLPQSGDIGILSGRP